MSIRLAGLALGAALLAAGAYAAFGQQAPSTTPDHEATAAPATGAPVQLDPHAALGGLPPGHPPVGATSHGAPMLEANSGPPAITWTRPAAWADAPSPSSMRLATYRAPRAPGDDDDADLSVSRAGGSTSANLERWVGQFDDAGKDVRSERTVQGLKVTVVEVSGTYVGGTMLAQGASARRPHFRLLGAVVETAGGSYFFKLTGPDATVRAARPAFDAMIDGIAKAS